MTLPDGTKLDQRTSDNPGPTRVRTQETFGEDGRPTQRITEVETGASQFFAMPDFSGENWTMYTGIAIILLGIAAFFSLLTRPLAPYAVGAGVALIAFGSFLKTPIAPWITGIVLVSGLGIVAYRNRHALLGVTNGVEKLDDETKAKAKASIDTTTTESDDKVIREVKS